MSLLNRYTANNNQPTQIEQAPHDSEVESVNTLVDITIGNLSDAVNLPPDSDPFVIYLQQYVESLLFILDRIQDIKLSEKALKKRVREAIKLLQTLRPDIESVEVFVDNEVSTSPSAAVAGVARMSDFN